MFVCSVCLFVCLFVCVILPYNFASSQVGFSISNTVEVRDHMLRWIRDSSRYLCVCVCGAQCVVCVVCVCDILTDVRKRTDTRFVANGFTSGITKDLLKRLKRPSRRSQLYIED